MKRRALLLSAALLAPTAAVAQTARVGRQGKPVIKPLPPPPSPTTPARATVALPVVKGAKTQLVAFNTSAFPYIGIVPDTKKIFFDVKQGNRRGHTTERGTVCWDDQAYHDRRSLLHLPHGYNPALPGLIVLYFHGNSATLERDVIGRQGIVRQVNESGQNIALVAPQLALDAPDSSAGNFWKPGHLAHFIDEAAERLMRLYGDQRIGPHFNASPVVVVSYSGGYLPAAYGLERGGATFRIKGVILMDSLFGDGEKFADWVGTRRQSGFLLSAYSDASRDENENLRGMLRQLKIPSSDAMPRNLSPGTMTFLSCGNAELHNDFMTKAWGQDPLAQALAMIPGYPQTAPQIKKMS